MSILELGGNCEAFAAVTEAAALVDAHTYYRAVHRAICGARRYLLISAWQLDSQVQLLRGDDAAAAEAPTELLPLLNWACERSSELQVYLLAWDFSPVFLLEREWFQERVFGRSPSGRIHFRWDSFLPPHASHHQKLFIADGDIAFAGGMDICCSRWDTRKHELDDPQRHDGDGQACKPYHDVQAFVSGPAVGPLQTIFRDRWLYNGGDMPRLEPRGAPPALRSLTDEQLPIDLPRVAISQTWVAPERERAEPIRHVRQLYLDAIRAAEQLVYIETQYFTARAVLRAFIERLEDTQRSKLEIVIVIPQGGDTPKEKFALGDAQAFVLNAIRRAADVHGHRFGVFFSGCRRPDGELQPTFIHSKLLIVDDKLLSIGSANLTNRSLGLDTELNLSWEDAEPVAQIARLRASLLAEHCGSPEIESYLPPAGLVARLLAEPVDSRLLRYEIAGSSDLDPLLSLATDPEGPLNTATIDARIDEAWESFDKSLFSRGFERWLARHDKGDVADDGTSK